MELLALDPTQRKRLVESRSAEAINRSREGVEDALRKTDRNEEAAGTGPSTVSPHS